MKKTLAILFSGLVLAALATGPAAASGFHLFGSYSDFQDLDDALGAGLGFTFDLGEVVQLEARTSYYEQIDSDELGNIFDGDDFEGEDVFLDGVQVQPIELGVRFPFDRGGAVNPYFGIGAGYYLLDLDNGELDDEVGFYGLGGLTFGDAVGPSFFIEAQYREIEGNVTDIDDIDEIDDIDVDFDEPIDIDVGGFAANAGIVWRF